MTEPINWKEEIAKLVYVKQVLANVDTRKLFPHHLPKVRATSDQIRKCEEALGFSLDRDHREFLLHANGWDGFMQATNLFGTADFLGSDRFKAAESLLDGYEDVVFRKIGVPRRGMFSIAASPLDGDIFAMLKPDVAFGPRIFWLAGDEIDRFPTFTEFFLSMMDYNRLGIKRLQQG